MKKVLLGVLCLAVCASALAQTKTAGKRFEEPTVIDIKVNPTQLYRQATGVRALVSSENADNAFIFAVVGSAPGAGGLYYKSQVTLVNNDTVFGQDVAVLYFPSSGGNCNGGAVTTLHLKANTFYVWNDFVGSVFNTTGLGSVVILGVDSAGNFDSTANIDGFSRIWTPIPGFRGTASQSFPGVALSGYSGTQWIYGLQNDSEFRTNVFIFNYDPTNPLTRSFHVNVVGLNGSGSLTMNVPPCSLGVASLGANNYGALIVSVAPPDANAAWFAFGSTVDNSSGDNWSVAARPDVKP
jgi:hypothetical protein